MEFLFILIVVALIAFVVYNNVKKKNKREERGSRKVSPAYTPPVETPRSTYSNPVARPCCSPTNSCSTPHKVEDRRRVERYSEEVEVIPVPIFVDTTPFHPVFADNPITIQPESIHNNYPEPVIEPAPEPVFESSSRDFGGGSSGGGGASASWEPTPRSEPVYSAPEPTPTYSAPSSDYSSSYSSDSGSSSSDSGSSGSSD